MSKELPDVIVLSGYAGSGKDEAARHLASQHGYVNVKLAGALKAMLRALLAYQGLPSWDIEDYIEGKLKEDGAAELGFNSPRYAMQTLGTEWGRKYMGEDYWAEVTGDVVSARIADGNKVVITDARFPNEIETLRKYCDNLKTIRIYRGNGGPRSEHLSERSMEDYQFDACIANDQNLPALYRTVDKVLEDISPCS